MKIKFGDNVLSATGNQSGSTYKKGPYGFVKYNKQRTNPIKVREFGSIQSTFSDLSNEWRKLTQVQRGAWNNFNNDLLSGFDDFMSCNLNRLICGTTILTEPQLNLNPDFLNGIWFAGLPQTNRILWFVEQLTSVNTIAIMYASTLRNASIMHTPKQYKIIDITTMTPNNPQNISFQYNYFFTDNWINYPDYHIPFKARIIDLPSGRTIQTLKTVGVIGH